MSEIELYQNIQIENSPKPQVKEVYMNIKLVIRLTDMRLFNALEHKFIFFEIPKWLMKQNDFTSVKLYGKITKVSPLGFQINYTQWFPKSQIINIFYLNERRETDLIKLQFIVKRNYGYHILNDTYLV